MQLTRDNVLWFAGLFEGEGYFRFCPLGRRSMGIAIKMTDMDVLEKVQRMFDGRLWLKQKKLKPHHKQSYTWMLDKRNLAYAVLMAVYPYLGMRRQKQIEKWVNQYKHLTIKAPAPLRHGFETTYVYHGCRCVECKSVTAQNANRRYHARVARKQSLQSNLI